MAFLTVHRQNSIDLALFIWKCHLVINVLIKSHKYEESRPCQSSSTIWLKNGEIHDVYTLQDNLQYIGKYPLQVGLYTLYQVSSITK